MSMTDTWRPKRPGPASDRDSGIRLSVLGAKIALARARPRYYDDMPQRWQTVHHWASPTPPGSLGTPHPTRCAHGMVWYGTCMCAPGGFFVKCCKLIHDRQSEKYKKNVFFFSLKILFGGVYLAPQCLLLVVEQRRRVCRCSGWHLSPVAGQGSLAGRRVAPPFAAQGSLQIYLVLADRFHHPL